MDLPDLLRGIIQHVMRRTMFYGLYRYRVISQARVFELSGGGTGGDTVSLQAVGTVEGLPDLVSLPKCHGLAGTTEELAPSTLVLVAFEGGDPGVPFIAHYMPGQPAPVSITLRATQGIYLAGAAPVALAAAVDSNIAALLAAVNVLNAAATPPKPALPGLPGVGASKVFAS